jgi:hypothetical protein
MLQSLQLLASKANVPEEAVMSMYENIDKARKEALNGNQEYIASLNRLGVTMDDIRTLSKEEFLSKAVAGVQKIQAGAPNGDISKADNLNRLDIEKITGTPENFLNQIGQSLNGNTMIGEKKEQEATGQIIPEDKVNELSATWANLIVDLKQVGTDLKPAAGFLIAIFDELVNALGGIVTSIEGVWDILVGIGTFDGDSLKKGLQELGGIAMNIGIGILKIFTNVFDLIAKGFMSAFGNMLSAIGNKLPKWLGGSKIAEAGKSLTELSSFATTNGATAKLNEWAKVANDSYGISGKTAKRGEGVANTAALLLTGGESGIAKGAQYGLGKMAAVASKLGMENKAEYLLNKSFNLRNKAAGTEGLFGGQTITDRILGKREPVKAKLQKLGDDGFIVKNDTFKKMSGFSKEGIASLKIAGGIGALGALTSTIKKGMKPGTPGSAIVPPIPNIGAFLGTSGGETSGIKMGGVFGSNYQSRMVLLNQKMVELLGQISSNTAGIKASTATGGQTPTTGYGGGL